MHVCLCLLVDNHSASGRWCRTPTCLPPNQAHSAGQFNVDVITRTALRALCRWRLSVTLRACLLVVGREGSSQSINQPNDWFRLCVWCLTGMVPNNNFVLLSSTAYYCCECNRFSIWMFSSYGIVILCGYGTDMSSNILECQCTGICIVELYIPYNQKSIDAMQGMSMMVPIGDSFGKSWFMSYERRRPMAIAISILNECLSKYKD